MFFSLKLESSISIKIVFLFVYFTRRVIDYNVILNKYVINVNLMTQIIASQAF